MVDPGDEAERLPGAGSCHHEDGTERRFDGEALLGKRVEIHARNLDRGPATTIALTLELPVQITRGLRRFLHVLVEELERRAVRLGDLLLLSEPVALVRQPPVTRPPRTAAHRP